MADLELAREVKSQFKSQYENESWLRGIGIWPMGQGQGFGVKVNVSDGGVIESLPTSLNECPIKYEVIGPIYARR